jgi:hypothetical protein
VKQVRPCIVSRRMTVECTQEKIGTFMCVPFATIMIFH